MKRLVASSFSVALRGAAIFAALCVATPLLPQQRNEIRSVPLTGVTEKGQILAGLQAQSFRVKYGTAAVKGMTLDAAPRRIVLLLDMSGSMLNEEPKNSKWQNARQMAKAFLVHLPASDWVSLCLFATNEKEIVPFTHNLNSIQKAIDNLPDPDSKPVERIYGRMTYFGDAIAAILAADHEPATFGDSIVVFSDGEFGSEGKVEMGKLLRPLLARGMRVFLVAADPQLTISRGLAVGHTSVFSSLLFDGGPDSRELAESEQLEYSAEFALATGGVAIEAEPLGPYSDAFNPDSVDRMMAETAQLVQNTYQVELSFENPLQKKRKIDLELVDTRGKPNRKIMLLYPRSLEPASKVVH